MKNDLVVVGIGSSAGGLEALQIMLSTLPDIPNCAYIIAQHLSPTHKSMMVELLTRITNIPVIEVKNGMVIRQKSIYMTPENTDIYVSDGKMYLKNIEQSFGPRPSVNYFFSSLAKDFNHRAIGIILSGTGSDGAYGIRAIKAEGGITIAQSPTTAKYDGMPLSAINTGKVDLVVSIDKLSTEIEGIVTKLDSGISISSNERILQQIYRILFEEYGVDFSMYKKTTITRRLERRIAALKLDSIRDYFDKFKDNKDEICNLYHDILIGVTGFFRDKDAFELLKEQIQGIISKKEQGEEIRFWSIGCSTGEEAYTIAIILSEILQEKIDKYKIKIFATDIDDESLQIARSGVYAETSMQEVDKSILQKYFSLQKNNFEVKKKLRELVIFSRHNVISDSPFLRLDMVVCRNMLIYFSQALQNKFFPIIHYSLNDNGVLFLGKSESIGSHIDLFNLLDKNAKIFKAQYTGIKEPPKLYNYSTSFKGYEEPKVKKFKNDEEVLEDKIVEAVGSTILDKCVVINSSNDMIYKKGKIPYLNHLDGKVSNNIFKLIEQDLALDLRSAINEASKSKQIKQTPFRAINVFEDIVKYVRVFVVPILDDRSEDWFNILFFQAEDTQNIRGHIIADGNESDIIEKLTLELDSTKSHLQNVIEELETSYEEMQSLNEELQSSNEELQSSNEELETTNEELQSTNEELQTAYSELRVLYDDKDKRTKQLESLMEKLNGKTEDLRKQKEIKEAILETTPVAVTMVDTEGQITYANACAEKLFELDRSTIKERTYDSPAWKIKQYNGEEFDLNNLPFSIVKRTFESVYDVRHTIEMGNNIKYLSISGSPLFDPQGIFQGAVFCVEDETNARELKADILGYQKREMDANYKLTDNEILKDDLLKISMIDTIVSFKNDLNQVSLLAQTIHEDDDLDIRDALEEKVQDLSKALDTKIGFYTQSSYYENSLIKGELDYFLTVFEPVFFQNHISVKTIKNGDFNKTFSTLELKKTFYYLFTFIVSIKSNINNQESFEVVFECSEDKSSFSISMSINGIDFDATQIEEKFNLFNEMVENENIQVSNKLSYSNIECKVIIES